MSARHSKLLRIGAALAIAASSWSAGAQQSTNTTPGEPATAGGPTVRTNTGPRTGSRLPPLPPAASRPSTPQPAPAYNPSASLEQRQNQLRNIAIANPGDRYSPGNFGRQLDQSGRISEGTFSRRGLHMSSTSAASSALNAQASWSGDKFSLSAQLNLGRGNFRPQTVNDLIYGINYWNDWYDRDCACSRSSSLTEGGGRLMGGFLAEPFEPSSVFPGVNPTVFASMTAAAPAEEPLTAVDLADEALMSGRAADAVKAYKSHLDTAPADGPTLVRMSIALIESGNPSDGVAVLMKAYRDDPTVAGVSLRPMTESWQPSRTRALVTKAVTHANRDRGASAWATVAVLMVADGRETLAGQMLDRSIAAGLDSEIATQIRSATISASRPIVSR